MGPMPGAGPRNFGPPGHGMGPRMDMPRMDGPPDPRMEGPGPGQMFDGYGSRIDSPKFDGLGSRLDQGLTNDFAALNLQMPGSNLKVNEISTYYKHSYHLSWLWFILKCTLYFYIHCKKEIV